MCLYDRLGKKKERKEGRICLDNRLGRNRKEEKEGSV